MSQAEQKLPRLQQKFRTEVVPALQQEFGIKNVMKVPGITKITLNMGLGDAVGNQNIVKSAVAELSIIAGQKAVATKAKKSIAGFKLREGMAIGCSVTLRGPRMWEFLDRLISVALPRVRDFRGTSNKAFDGRGNYSLGLKDQLIFPEINYDKVEKVKGLSVNITTSAETDEQGRALLKQLGMPMKKD